MKELKTTRRSVVRERALLVEVEVVGDCDSPSPAGAAGGLRRAGRRDGHRDRLEELARLTDAAGADVVARATQRRTKVHPGTYVGHGKAEQLRDLAGQSRANVIIFDNDLSPGQVRNLEEVTAVKVIDRSELILDIFAARARTNEARLQVELAQLEYTYPRLKQMWTHLSRLEGGGLGARGPGETQLETDRRLVRLRIHELQRRIREIDQRREREVGSRGESLTVGLVGYTNAGKSSLLNALTGAHAHVEDRLFATLDTRTRAWRLPHGLTALLSDTVGFIRDLPHHLVASFKATLEEAIHADLLLHVADVSTEHLEADLEAVAVVLEEIGCIDKPQLLVLNKADLVEDAVRMDLALRAHPEAVAASAVTGRGLDDLARAVAERLAGPEVEASVRASAADGRLLAWIEQHATILARTHQDGDVVHRLRIPERLLDRMPRVATRDFAVTPDPPAPSGT